LEGAEDCLLSDSGMSAIITTILALLSKGDHLVLTDDAYKQTLMFVMKEFPRFGFEFTIVPMSDYGAMEKAVKPNTVLIFSESPTNPYLNIVDLIKLREIKKRTGVLTMIDSTFATPFNQRPLEWGVDLVIHSATKYLAGHNDILAGVTLGKSSLIGKVRDFQKAKGGIIDPHCCYLLLRGLKTFALRVDHQNRSGQQVAEWLESNPHIKQVYYPGLPSHRNYDVAKAQMKGYGGVVSFKLNADINGVGRFLDALNICRIAPSLGGVETLITHPASVSYYNNPKAEREALGITDDLVRLALGIEAADDIIEDLDQAIKIAFK
jgi:cystathionine gamma-synthase